MFSWFISAPPFGAEQRDRIAVTALLTFSGRSWSAGDRHDDTISMLLPPRPLFPASTLITQSQSNRAIGDDQRFSEAPGPPQELCPGRSGYRGTTNRTRKVAMAAQNSDHDKARELAEKALDKLVEGDEAAGDKLIKQAEKIDPTAIDEVAEDLDISDDDIEQAEDSGKGDAQK
jgi:hypothetical protein